MSTVETVETITLGSSGMTVALLSIDAWRYGIEVISRQDRVAVMEPMDLTAWPYSGNQVIPSVMWASDKTEPRRLVCELKFKLPAPVTLRSALYHQVDAVRLIDHLENELNISLERATGFTALVDAYYVESES